MTEALRVVVTGSRGGVGARGVRALLAAGHEVLATDQLPQAADDQWEGHLRYVQADLNDAGSAYALVRDADVVIHAGAIPRPGFHPDHVVFMNNMGSTFNILEAAVRSGVRRFVNVSSDSVSGFLFPERPFLPQYVPIDELHPAKPQDPYALSKYFAELLMDAAVRRSDICCISLRPPWVQHPNTYARNLSLPFEDASAGAGNAWSYVDADDLADALVLAATSDLPGHEIFYIAAADNMVGRPLAELVSQYYGAGVELRAVERSDASGVSCAKAARLLGYVARRSWRDYLDDTGEPLAGR